jgi:hypothetical protein
VINDIATKKAIDTEVSQLAHNLGGDTEAVPLQPNNKSTRAFYVRRTAICR